METFEVDGFKITLNQDEDVESPREWMDHFSTMVYWHRRYVLGDVDGAKHGIDPDVRWLENINAVYLPLYLYDHSVLRMSTQSFVGRAQHADWDSGMVGFVYASLDAIRKEYGVGRVSAKLRDKVTALLKAEVEEFDQYLSGDVWEYVIEDAEGNTVDSLCGMYGYEYAKQSALDALAHHREIISRRTEEGQNANV